MWSSWPILTNQTAGENGEVTSNECASRVPEGSLLLRDPRDVPRKIPAILIEAPPSAAHRAIGMDIRSISDLNRLTKAQHSILVFVAMAYAQSLALSLVIGLTGGYESRWIGLGYLSMLIPAISAQIARA